MNRLHPLRKEEVFAEFFEEKSFVFSCTVIVTDIMTKESRSGSGVHPVISYEAGTEAPKSLKKAREHMNNAKKSALTKALRNAYSNFGVGSDLDDSQLRAKPNEEQRQRFNSILPTEKDYMDFDPLKEEGMKKWIIDRMKFFDEKLAMEDADEYIDKLNNKIQQYLKEGKTNA